MAKVEDIEIHTGRPEFEFEAIRRLEVKCEASNALMPAPTIEEANGRLRALAARAGANAIIEVNYNSGVSFTSWKSLKATGLAVRRLSDERQCPMCAETIKRAAVKCRFCGADLEAETASPTAGPAASQPTPQAIEQEPLRDNNNPVLIISLAAGGLFLLMLMLSLMSR